MLVCRQLRLERLAHELMLTEHLACWLPPVAADKHSDFITIKIKFLLLLILNLTYLRSIHYISSAKGLMIPSLQQLGEAGRQWMNAVLIPGPSLNPQETREIHCLDRSLHYRLDSFPRRPNLVI